MENEIMTATPQKRSLIAKLAKVMADISRVKKNGTNKFQNYAYATEADLVEEVRGKLGAAGIFIFTEVVEVTQRETGRKTSGGLAILITRVKVKHTFCDSDSSETFELHSYGEGEDSGDKGIYKATTGAVKYFLAKNFLMSTGDDPEEGNDADQDNAKTKPKSKAQERPGFSTGVPMEQHLAQQADEMNAIPPSQPKAGTVTRPQADLGSFEDRIKFGKETSRGKTGAGAPWILYSIETEGHGAFSTFSTTVFEDAIAAQKSGAIVMVHTEPTPKGPKINGIEFKNAEKAAA